MRSTSRFMVLAFVALVACSSEPPKEPERVRVQYVLIGFHGSMGNFKEIARTRDEAQQLAADVLRRAKAGEDFDTLVSSYSDDRAPGILQLANDGPLPPEGVLPRVVLPQSLGDVAFRLGVGDVALAEYDPTRCPMGWYVMRRLE